MQRGASRMELSLFLLIINNGRRTVCTADNANYHRA